MVQLVNRHISIDLYNFLNSMKVVGTGTLVNQGNIIDKTETYISRMYTPDLRVSNVTKNLLQNLGVIAIIDTDLHLDTDSITYWLLQSDLRTKDFKLYNLFKAILADMYSYTYAIDSNPDYLRFINKKDFTRTISNINYIIDYLSSEGRNANIIEQLYEINTALGVIKNQLDFIKNEKAGDNNA